MSQYSVRFFQNNSMRLVLHLLDEFFYSCHTFMILYLILLSSPSGLDLTGNLLYSPLARTTVQAVFIYHAFHKIRNFFLIYNHKKMVLNKGEI
jgi:hypothetical protein